ncbi:AI-2E family transporter [Candidatus Kaiserbacteria bacterium]|nr:AI-2E family transporter [Candidatus Kaiserbacteria bacterium]
MNVKILQPYFLLGLIAASSVLVFFIFRPFLIALVLAAIFATVLHPLYEGIYRWTHRSPGFAAFVTILIALVCILGPLSFVAVQIANDAQDLYVSLSDGTSRAYLDTVFGFVNSAVATYAPHLSLSAADLSTSFDQYVKDGLQWLIQNLGGAFGSAARFLATLFLFLIALYYLFRDGDSLKQTIVRVSPLVDADDNMVFSQLRLSVQSVVRGSLVVALIQGVLTGIGFAIFGVPNSVLWGVVAAFSALVPGIGTSLILIPGIAYLFIAGATTPAIGLLIWSVLAVGLIDNFLSPRLMGRGMQLHPLPVFLSVFGGLIFFGPVGVLLGPLCTSTLFTFLSLYQNIRRQSA